MPLTPESPSQAAWRRKIEDRLRRLETRRSLGQSQIGEGGLVVQGGEIVIKDAAGNVLITLDGAGLTASPDGTITLGGPTAIDGSLTLAGDLTATAGTLKSGNYAAGSAGWRLQPSGNVEINDITLRGGIIGNPALASPVSPSVLNQDRMGLNLPGTDTVLATDSVTVPTGYTKALVMATAMIGCLASGSFPVIAHVRINSQTSNGQGASGSSNDAILATDSLSVLLTGLSAGGSVTASALGSCIGAQSGSGSAVVSAIVLFLR